VGGHPVGYAASPVKTGVVVDDSVVVVVHVSVSRPSLSRRQVARSRGRGERSGEVCFMHVTMKHQRAADIRPIGGSSD
jgi:hypothetical protein